MKSVSKKLLKPLQKESKITSKTKKGPIAFFDSGVGGLTVYAKLKALLPNEDYLYFGDTKHMPYGEKTPDELLKYTEDIFSFFIEREAKAVVMACNTTSSVVFDKIKDRYDLKIYPIIQSVAEVIAKLDISKVGVFATCATVNSNAYKKEIQKYNSGMDVVQIACPEWVKIVENNLFDLPESVAQIELKLNEMLKHNPDKIILGCTHYPYLKNILARFAPEDMFIDPSIYFAKYIKNDLSNSKLLEISDGKEDIFVSDSPENFKTASKMFYEMENLPQLAVINSKHFS